MTYLKYALMAFSGSLFLAGCSTTSERDYLVDSSATGSDADEYVYIVDYDKVKLIETANRTSHSNVETYWINPPLKRIKRSELEKMQ